jgi:hypothetical protein
MSTAAGLGIALLTMVVVGLIFMVFKGIFWLADGLQEMIFDSDTHVLWKILFLIPWLFLRAITVVLIILALICGISLAKDFVNWFKH